MSTTMPTNEDPSAGYSGVTKPTQDIPAPPNTSSWSENITNTLPTVRTSISMPTTPPVIVDPDTTDEQISAASVGRNMRTPAEDPGATAMSSAAGGVAGGAGYTAPSAAQASPQWYHLTGYTYTRDSGAAACVAFGGKMATKQQVIDAQANGASVCSAGYVSDDTARVYFPGQPGHCWGNAVHSQAMGDSAACCGGKWAVNCFGIKPPPATPGVAPWTDVAVTKNNNKYIANDWSERKGGEGTDLKPGTPTTTQEVYWVGLGTGMPNYNYSGPDAESICKAAGGDLATVAQVQAAQQRGAQWYAWGWVKGGTVAYPMQDGTGTTTRSDSAFSSVVNDANGYDFLLPTAQAIQTIPIYKKARYVRLMGSLTAGDGFLDFSYLRVNDANGNNISAGKPASFSQNTLQFESGTPASAPVTGTEGSRNSWNLGFHARATNTAADDSALWQVDLGSDHLISTIVYYGRSDCCGPGSGLERNRGVRIRLFTGTYLAGANCVGVKPPPAGVTATLPTSDLTQTVQINKKGRFVRVRGSLTSGDGYFLIGYLRVNDKNGNNISAGKTAFASQKTIGWDSQTASTNPIIGVEGTRSWQGFDDNRINPLNIYHSKGANKAADDSAYWQVDLGSEQDISTIIYYGCVGNDANRIRGVRIEVASTPVAAPFSTHSSPHAYNQNSYVNTGACPAGSTKRDNCPGGPACFPNGQAACAQPSCPPGATQGC